MTLRVALEVGKRRAFAAALDWPGWVRSGRDEAGALDALVAAAPRYVAAIGDAGGTFTAPSDASRLDVVARLEGDATTDFGAPSIPAPGDDEALEAAELGRQVGILRECWAAFDASAAAAANAVLRKGPRGGAGSSTRSSSTSSNRTPHTSERSGARSGATATRT